MSKVLIVSDLHFPFHHKPSYKKLMRMLIKEKPTHVVQIGDVLDQYVFSKYSKDPGISDVERGLKDAQEFWEQVRKYCPRALRIQILGNHDLRLSKRISERMPELSSFFSHKDLYKFKGVTMMSSDRDYVVIDGVVYCHGWLSHSIDHAKFFNKPCVHGHRHRPAIETYGKLWSMDTGYMADPASKPLSYTMSKFTKWTHACGIVEDGKPRLILL
jgi:predicted phosphodiesterase